MLTRMIQADHMRCNVLLHQHSLPNDPTASGRRERDRIRKKEEGRYSLYDFGTVQLFIWSRHSSTGGIRVSPPMCRQQSRCVISESHRGRCKRIFVVLHPRCTSQNMLSADSYLGEVCRGLSRWNYSDVLNHQMTRKVIMFLRWTGRLRYVLASST